MSVLQNFNDENLYILGVDRYRGDDDLLQSEPVSRDLPQLGVPVNVPKVTHGLY